MFWYLPKISQEWHLSRLQELLSKVSIKLKKKNLFFTSQLCCHFLKFHFDCNLLLSLRCVLMSNSDFSFFIFLVSLILHCLVIKSCRTLLWPHGLELTRLLYPWDIPGKNTVMGGGWPFASLRGLPDPGIGPSLMRWQENSLPLSHQSKEIVFSDTIFPHYHI